MNSQKSESGDSGRVSASGNPCQTTAVRVQDSDVGNVAATQPTILQLVIAAIRSRLADYVFAGVLFAIAAPIGAYKQPYCRSFEWNDPTINYPFAPNTFPVWSVTLCMILVCFVYVLGEYISHMRCCTSKFTVVSHINGWVVTHLYSITIAFVIVNLTKLYAGRLRPDFLDRLRRENITQTNFNAIIAEQLCAAARDGRLSFPSGHSSSIFSGITPVCIYLLGLFRVLHGGSLILVFVALLPMILPITVAVSRTRDHRHNFDDVLAGSCIGIASTALCVWIMFKPNSYGEWTLRARNDERD